MEIGCLPPYFSLRVTDTLTTRVTELRAQRTYHKKSHKVGVSQLTEGSLILAPSLSCD